MERLLQGLTMGLQLGMRDTTDNLHHPDTGEAVNISALSLIKMMKHARSGVPLEVMGLMLGNFVDDYTINVVDVFAMPQSGTSVTVESVDPVYQTKMMDLFKQTGRTEMVVGWYHSHPGFGCWLSNVDVQTQQSFEALHPRAVAVVVDPIQSVKGKVVLEAFRSINQMALNPRQLAPTGEARQCTSNLGNLTKPSLVSTVHGLGSKYYSLVVNYKCSANEQVMISSLHQKNWTEAIRMGKFADCTKENQQKMEEMIKLTKLFTKDMAGDAKLTKRQKFVKDYGRLNSKQRLEQATDKVMEENIIHQLKAISNSHAIH